MTVSSLPAAGPARDEAAATAISEALNPPTMTPARGAGSLKRRADRARDEHHALHQEFLRHIRWAWDEDSDDWRCRTGGSCDEADRIHREATAAGERLDLAVQDEQRARRQGWSVVR